MADLFLNVVVEGAKEAEKDADKLSDKFSEVSEQLEKISLSDAFTSMINDLKVIDRLATEADESVDNLAKSFREAYQSGDVNRIRDAKTLLYIEKDLNAEIEKQARLQARINALKVSSGSLNSLRQSMQEQQNVTFLLEQELDALEKGTKEMQKLANTRARISDEEVDRARQLKNQLENKYTALTALEQNLLKNSKEVIKKYGKQIEEERAKASREGLAAQKKAYTKHNKEVEKATKRHVDELADLIGEELVALKQHQREKQAIINKGIHWELKQNTRKYKQQQKEQNEHLRKEERQLKESLKRRRSIVSGLSAGFGNIGRAFSFGAGAGLGLGVVSAGITALTGAIQRMTQLWTQGLESIARSYFTINTELEKQKILLATASGSVEAGQDNFQRILEYSTEAPFSVDALTKSFVKLKTAGLDPLKGIMPTLVDSIAAFGGTDENLHLATIAIQQMVGKGVISMEELRRQFGEQVPTAMRAMADGMGMTMLELFDTIKDGALDAGTGIRAMFTELEKRHGGAASKLMDTMTGSLARLRTAWIRLMEYLGTSNNSFRELRELIDNVTQALNNLRETEEGQKLLEELSKSMVNLFKTLGDPKFIEAAMKAIVKSIEAVFNAGVQLIEIIQKIHTFLSESKGLSDSANSIEILSGDFSHIEERAKEAAKEAESPFMELANTVKESFVEVGEAVGNVAKKAKEESKRTYELGDPLDPTQYDKAIEANIAKLNKFQEDFYNEAKNISLDEEKLRIEIETDTALDYNKELLTVADTLAMKSKEASTAGEDGWKKQLEYLMQAREVIKDMKTKEDDKVSDKDVEKARQRYNSFLRRTGGGNRAVGWAKEELELRKKNYELLKKAKEEGTANPLAGNELKLQQYEALKKNTEAIQQLYKNQEQSIRDQNEQLREQREIAVQQQEAKKEYLATEKEIKTKSEELLEIRKELLEKAKESYELRGYISETLDPEYNALKEKKELAEQELNSLKGKKEAIEFNVDLEKQLSEDAIDLAKKTSLEKVKQETIALDNTRHAYDVRKSYVNKEIADNVTLIESYRKLKEAKIEAANAGATTSQSGEVDGAKARGGMVKQGNTYLVGERGPELFKPAVSGDIIPNNQLKQERSHRDIVDVNFSINGSDPIPLQGTRNSVEELQYQLKEQQRYAA